MVADVLDVASFSARLMVSYVELISKQFAASSNISDTVALYSIYNFMWFVSDGS